MFVPGHPGSRHLRLSTKDGAILCMPRDRRRRRPQPLLLPRLPLSLIGWCEAITERFWREQHVCLAVALLVDPRSRRWSTFIPSQTSTRTASRWQIVEEDYAHLHPRISLAGSYQLIRRKGILQASRAVPSFDGIHVVRQPAAGGRACRTWIFVRLDGNEAMLADPAATVIDDQDAVLRESLGRIRIS
jgi:hypothetical protein